MSKAKIIALALLFIFWCILPTTAASSPVESEAENQPTQVLSQPVQTYYLNVLPAAGRLEVKFNPPAINIAVTSQSGDTTVRCGDATNNYICSPGKRLEIRYDAAVPLAKFWAENTTETIVRLKIDVYEVTTVEDGSEENWTTVEP